MIKILKTWVHDIWAWTKEHETKMHETKGSEANWAQIKTA